MIKYYDRDKKDYKIEQVAGDKYLNWIYSSKLGNTFLNLFIKKKLFSKLYGWYCDKSLSKNKIDAFINEFNIDMNLYEIPNGGYKNFNDFFTRKLNSNKVNLSENVLISPGDGKLLAFENIDLNNIIQVKSFRYSLKELIKNDDIASKYQDGTCLVLRLCPTDYHRFHFIDSGKCTSSKKISGNYYSVNPVALNKINKLFCENKREWSILSSDNFGDILYIEVGATCVGTIIQTYNSSNIIHKGDEKGYFKFGGSTVILFLEKDLVKIDKDIVNQSLKGIETKVSIGESIGHKINC